MTVSLVTFVWMLFIFGDGFAPANASSMCTLMPGTTQALVHVEKDTTLPNGTGRSEMMSASGVRPGPYDSLLATPTTPMPAARVRLLQLDSMTRGTLASHGITDAQPRVFIRAAPYRADCRTIRWTDTVPFVLPGEEGYIRATLLPREQWVDGVPVLSIPDVWNYPYPRRRSVAYNATPTSTLAPADAVFSLGTLLEQPRPRDNEARIAQDSVKRQRALGWARANIVVAELEPLRTWLGQAIIVPDWENAMRVPSRLRGTYRVDMEADGVRASWFFRTTDRPAYTWRGPAPVPMATVVSSPHVFGYSLLGYAAPLRDSIIEPSRMARDRPLVWFKTTDRPTTAGNEARRELSGQLEFVMGNAPESLWNTLDAFAPSPSARDSAMMARMRTTIPRDRTQPNIPLTVRLDRNGAVRADTTIVARGRTLKLKLERVDTLSFPRPF